MSRQPLQAAKQLRVYLWPSGLGVTRCKYSWWKSILSPWTGLVPPEALESARKALSVNPSPEAKTSQNSALTFPHLRVWPQTGSVTRFLLERTH